jgi:hypothetical protein
MPDDECDGWEQCPQGDNELLCDVGPCPDSCLCQGLAFLCHRPFSSDNFPALRYLDVQNAPLNVSQLPALTQTYIVCLRVNNGSGVVLPEVEFSNLQTVDLSGNNIKMVNMTGMMFLPNLKVLRLSNNPLTMLYANDNVTGNIRVEQLDLSNTALKTFDSTYWHIFAHVTKLSISRSTLQSIGDGGFKSFPQLEELDVRENPLKPFQCPHDAFEGVTHLSVFHSPYYRLCCVNSFASLGGSARCVTNERTLSSCEDLLRSSAHQVALMTLTVVTVLVNALCILIRHIKYHEFSESTSFSVLMNSLNIANLFSGVYCGIVAFADVTFRSKYFPHELSWRRSAMCKAAGFVSLLSHRLSALLMVIITLERLVDVRGVKTWRFGRTSTIAVSLVAWFVGLTLAVIPLLPATWHWEYYGQTAMCVPLPCSFDHSARGYHFALDTILHIVLVTLMTAGQIFVYVSLPQNSILKASSMENVLLSENSRAKTRNSQDDLTRAFFKLAVTVSAGSC